MNRLLVALLLSLTQPALAQEAERPALITTGVSAGVIRFKSGLSEYVLTGLLQLQPRPWLTLGTAATGVRVAPQDSTAYSGFGDLPVSLGISKRFDGTAAPSLGAVFQVSLPTGTQSKGKLKVLKVVWR